MWGNIIEKGIDLTNVVFSFIDSSDFTPEERAEKKNEILKLKLDKIKIDSSVLKRALGVAKADSVSGNKFQSYARPAIIWLFIFLISVAFPLGFLNYCHNDLYLATIDGIKTFWSIIPESVIIGFYSVIGIHSIGRSVEKVTKIMKGVEL